MRLVSLSLFCLSVACGTKRSGSDGESDAMDGDADGVPDAEEMVPARPT